MKYCKDCWSFGRCNADGKTVDFPVDEGVCIDFDECKPETNADRIRAMTDEELVDWLLLYLLCSVCPMQDYCSTTDLPCEKVILEWLQQPAEGE